MKLGTEISKTQHCSHSVRETPGHSHSASPEMEILGPRQMRERLRKTWVWMGWWSYVVLGVGGPSLKRGREGETFMQRSEH